MATDNWINPHTRIEQESRCIVQFIISFASLPLSQSTSGTAGAGIVLVVSYFRVGFFSSFFGFLVWWIEQSQ